MRKFLAIGSNDTIIVQQDKDRIIKLKKLDNSWKVEVGSYVTYVSSIKEFQKNWLL